MAICLENPAIAHLLASAHPARPLHDLLGRMTSQYRDDQSLVLTGDLRAGLYQMSLVTRDGSFDNESLYLNLLEWPSRKSVKAGPFDFDHTDYGMVVPTFRVWVDGEDGGLVWCDTPSVEDWEARRVRAVFGIEIRKSGRHEIVLQTPDDDQRVAWSDVNELIIRDDDRRKVVLPLRADLQGARPRLLLEAKSLETLKTARDTVQDTLLAELTRAVEAGNDGTYSNRTVKLALLAVVTGKKKWAKEAITRTVELCERPYWGYHDVHEVMGWNSDRDTGVRMYETAIVYDWLYDQLTKAQRRLIREKLIYHSRIAYKITRVQKSYWYHRSIEAHGLGFYFGFAAAAGALHGEHEEAGEWLAWIHGNIQDSLRYMPEDGVIEWPVFNAQWLILTTILLEWLQGGRVRCNARFVESLARNVIGASQAQYGGDLALLLFGLAERQQNGRFQADALRAARVDEAKPSSVDPLSLLIYDPQLAPGTVSKCPTAFCSENGIVACRGANDVTFHFKCGTPVTAKRHQYHGWNARAWYGAAQMGSFSWNIGKQEFAALALKGYRTRTEDANLISVDGAGCPTHGRWLGTDIELSQTAFIESFAHRDGVTYCCANGSHSYVAASGVRNYARRWIFLHEHNVMLMLDRIVTDQPRQLSWVFNSPTECNLSKDRCTFSADGSELIWRSLHTRWQAGKKVGKSVKTSLEPCQWVPAYVYGINTYQTLDWQPEIQGMFDIPAYQRLRVQPKQAAEQWEQLTIMTPNSELAKAASATSSEQGLAIELPSVGSVTFAANELSTGDGTVSADAVFCGNGRALCFAASAWDSPSGREKWPGTVNFQVRGGKVKAF